MQTILWLAGVLATTMIVSGPPQRYGQAAPRATVSCVAAVARPSLFEIVLAPTTAVRGAQGSVHLEPAASPFGVAVTADGHYRVRAMVQVGRLPAPASLGAYTTYVAWAATTNLQQVHRLGVVDDNGRATGEIRLNKFMVFVTAERSGAVDAFSGPVVLRGIAPSALMQNLLTHPLNNGGMPPC